MTVGLLAALPVTAHLSVDPEIEADREEEGDGVVVWDVNMVREGEGDFVSLEVIVPGIFPEAVKEREDDLVKKNPGDEVSVREGSMGVRDKTVVVVKEGVGVAVEAEDAALPLAVMLREIEGDGEVVTVLF